MIYVPTYSQLFCVQSGLQGVAFLRRTHADPLKSCLHVSQKTSMRRPHEKTLWLILKGLCTSMKSATKVMNLSKRAHRGFFIFILSSSHMNIHMNNA